MKKIYFSLLLICLSLGSFGQIINIPDANFKNRLVSTNCAQLTIPVGLTDVDTNNDGEIQIIEAQAVSGLDVSNSSISSLEGIQFFSNLTDLDCSHNSLTSLNLNNLPQLGGLFCNNNQISTLEILNLNSLSLLDISYNQLTTLAIPAIVSGEYLNIGVNPFNEVVIPNGTSVLEFYCNETPAASIDLSGARIDQYASVGNNPNLQFLNLKNGWGDYCFDIPGEPDGVCLYSFSVGNCPNLLSICVDDAAERAYFLTQVNQNVTTINEYCSFNPGGAYNTIAGNIKLDLDANGCTLADAVASNIPIRIVRATQDLGQAFTNGNGNYATYSSVSSQTTVSPQFENPYYTVTPASYTSSFVGFGNTVTANFCIAPNGIHNDLEAGLIPITPARPGFDATYKIVYKNKGTTTQSGTVTFNFSDFYTDFVSASSVPNNIQPDLLTWNFTNLAPLETREITIILNVNSPVETPAVNPGDLLVLGAQVSSSATDETYLDNIANLTQVVVGSFDPNDKQVSALSYYYELAEVEDLYYTIRFQNLGTFLAENVVVVDVLSNKLNESKLQMVSSSHPYVSRYNAQTRKLEFIFEGINLPAAIDDEPGSNGYVSFKIKPNSTLTPGQTIENKADIYFDFNAPIATNTTSTIIETLLKTDNFSNTAFTLHPNPAKNTVNINVASEVSLKSISIYNPLGQLVKTLTSNEINASLAIDVTSLKTGPYFIEINSNRGKTTKKFIKL